MPLPWVGNACPWQLSPGIKPGRVPRLRVPCAQEVHPHPRAPCWWGYVWGWHPSLSLLLSSLLEFHFSLTGRAIFVGDICIFYFYMYMYTNVFLWSFPSISQPSSALADSPLPVHISRLQPRSGFAAKSFTFSLLQLLWQTANCSHAAETNTQMSRAACSGAGLCSACPGLQAGCPDCTGARTLKLHPTFFGTCTCSHKYSQGGKQQGTCISDVCLYCFALDLWPVDTHRGEQHCRAVSPAARHPLCVSRGSEKRNARYLAVKPGLSRGNGPAQRSRPVCW